MDEAKVTTSEAVEVIRLIYEYLNKGGTGFDAEKLENFLDAILEADRIVITPPHEAEQ
jgi:hypothetical protein